MTHERKRNGSVGMVIQRWESALIGHQRTPADEVVSGSSWTPDETASYCAQCGGAFKCSVHERSCTERTLATRHGNVVRLSSYQEPVSEWIRMMKYRSWMSMANVLGELLGKSILECRFFDDEKSPWLVPVPMPWSRRFARGLDHAMLVCKGVSKTTGFKVFQPLKQINGRIQSGATVSQRSRKPDPFKVSLSGRVLRKRIEGRRVIVIDDVRTTGRTIGLVARALERRGAVVIGSGVLAVADAQGADARSLRSRHITNHGRVKQSGNGENLPTRRFV